MTATATIRVPQATRDQLAALASEAELSVSAYVTEMVRQQRRAAILSAAREEALDIAADPAAQADFAVWEGTLGDGLS